MAKRQQSTVRAIDIETGALVQVPKHEVAEIGVLPMGEDNMCIPASVRFFQGLGRYGALTRVTGIRLKGRRFPCVTWRDDRGQRSSCSLRHLADARDPLFAPLSARAKARLVDAVLAKVGEIPGTHS
jgi:hypothetical protein